MPADPVSEPFPIFALKGHYLLFDVNAVVSHVRSKHRMCGCLSGTLPQIPQQNVFLGLPLVMMIEEVAVLVEMGAAYLLDDIPAHKHGLQAMTEQDKRRYLRTREQACVIGTLAYQKGAEGRRAQYVREHQPNKAETPVAAQDPTKHKGKKQGEHSSVFGSRIPITSIYSEPAVETPIPSSSTASSLFTPSIRVYPTCTVSNGTYHLVNTYAPIQSLDTFAYSLYKYLHSAGYYLTPGLRFGCQFMAYPGDPLRFHSHFITHGFRWDQEVDLLHIVGGGRLGTGVKKAWLFGGNQDGENGKTRVFCVEWGGF
ncbi:tRNA-intron endonuclease catalytic domain-like protein [Wilcoxina mikolae CBS 423.85]|nr:tRNA-intron endonuclease catalytic domain-like protein [Wilcoxina mikolae CBS 423.85]